MIRFYLGEEPILDNVQTYLLSDPEQLEHVLGRLDQLVVKPTGESGGKGVFIGPATPPTSSRGWPTCCARDPERWIAQELVQPVDGPDGGQRRARWRRATSTCGRSRSSARTSRSSPAG